MSENKVVPNYVNIKIRNKPESVPLSAFSVIAPVKCYYTDNPPMWHYGHPWYDKLVHVGKDVCRNQTADVVAVADGTVRHSYNSQKWAGVTVIEHPVMVDGKMKYFTTNSWHINRIKNVGSKVKKGEKIETIYRGLRKLSGESNVNDHLHFGVRIGSFDSTYSQKGALNSANLRGFVDPDLFLKNPMSYLK